MKKKYLLFPFASADYRSAEAWLNEQAGNGLRLLELGVVTFVSVWEETDAPRRYAVTIWPPEWSLGFSSPEMDGKFEEFIQFAEGVGWHYLDNRDFIRIFEAEPGTDPAPLHTDPETELGLYRRLIVRRARNSAILLGALLAFAFLVLVSVANWTPVELLSINFFLVCLLGGGISALWNLWRLFHYGARLRRDGQAAREGRDLEIPHVSRVYARGMAEMIFGLVFSALLVAGALADFLYCPLKTYAFAVMMGSMLFQAAWSRRLYQRIKWPRYVGLVLSILVFVSAGWYAYRYTIDRDVHFRSRSPLLSYWDYYIFDGVEGIGDGSFLRCYRFESGIPVLLDWAYAAIQKEEALKDGQPPAGYARMAAENPAGEEHRQLLLAWEGHTVFLIVRGEDMTQPLTTLLECADVEWEGGS